MCGIAIIFRFASRVSRPCERDAEVSSDEFEAAPLLHVNRGISRNEGGIGPSTAKWTLRVAPWIVRSPSTDNSPAWTRSNA